MLNQCYYISKIEKKNSHICIIFNKQSLYYLNITVASETAVYTKVNQ